MLKLVIVSCFVALALGATIPDATESEEFLAWSGRIVGGSTASLGQFPYQASMRSAGNAHFCGGTLVSNRWNLCAAHCTVGRTTGNTIVVYGVISRTTGGTAHSTSAIANHPSYSSVTLANDISMVQTAAVVGFTGSISSVAMGSAFVTGGQAVASGWGQTSHPGSAAANLQFLVMNILTLADCRSRFSAANAARVFDNTICTFNGSGQGMCMGDSGGPLVGSGAVHGAVSWGIACAVGSPDVFARVSSHRPWINSVSGL